MTRRRPRSTRTDTLFPYTTRVRSLHWRRRSFLDAVHRAVPSTAGVLIQFPLYGGIAALLTHVPGADGSTLAHRLSNLFVHIAGQESFPAVMGAYSAILGFFVPRSEEHTSELQSLMRISYAVFCLKKQK